MCLTFFSISQMASFSETPTLDGTNACGVNRSVTLEEIQDILKKIIPENPKKSPAKSVPSGGQPSVWMIVNKDFSQCAQLDSYDEVYPNILLGDQ